MKQDKKFSVIFYTLAFAIPALLYMGLLAYEGIMPFGSEHSIAYVDANGQYVSFFSYYKQMLAGEQSLLFSFSKLIGGDMIGFSAYYLLSPFNLILLLFPAAKMAQAMAVMAVAKIGTAGLTAALFFGHHCGKNEKALFLSTSFALMSYNIIYMQNIMWIDGVIMLPLIALGIDFIFENRSCALYIFSLFFGILFNYYIGFMLCGASVLYFGYRFICCDITFRKKLCCTGRYAISSIFAGFMNMVVILPVFASLEGTTKESMPLNELIGLQTQNAFRNIAKHIFIPSETMQNIETMLPNIFTGFVVTALCAAFVLAPKISWRKKIAGGMIAVFFMLSFYFKTLYYFWHGFSKPICFEYRFAFIFSFFMLLWSAEFLSAVRTGKAAVILLAAVNCATLLWYGHINYDACRLHGNVFEEFMTENLPIVQDIKDMEAADGRFYRVEKDYEYNYNDPMALGTAGMTHFSSGEQLATRKAVQAAGYAFTEMYGYYGNGSTIASDSMFGIKYLLYKSTEKYNLEKVKDYENISVYKNPYSWPLAIKSGEAVTSA
ncbi:MAG: YfhO family protein, partial [Oscillospiraceae bacterium]|nr:YfhO family protein [Oscillospiraceae bacterium]